MVLSQSTYGSQEIECEFSDAFYRYTCIIKNASFSDETATIEGQHVRGKTNRDVTMVEVLSSNLSHFPLEIFDAFPNIEYLYIEHSEIGRLDQLRNCEEFINFDLRYSNLNVFSANVFKNCPKLWTFVIVDNAITEFSTQGLEQVDNLILMWCRLTSVPNLNNLVNLKDINLNGNQITELTGREFSGLTRLTTINLADNRISLIHPSTFQNSLPNLAYIDLKNNQISEIFDGTFASIKNIYYVGLDGNNLRRLKWNLFQNSNKVRILVLNDNQIEVIDEGFFYGLTALESILLANNVCINKDFFLVNRPGSMDSLRSEIAMCVPGTMNHV